MDYIDISQLWIECNALIKLERDYKSLANKTNLTQIQISEIRKKGWSEKEKNDIDQKKYIGKTIKVRATVVEIDETKLTVAVKNVLDVYHYGEGRLQDYRHDVEICTSYDQSLKKKLLNFENGSRVTVVGDILSLNRSNTKFITIDIELISIEIFDQPKKRSTCILILIIAGIIGIFIAEQSLILAVFVLFLGFYLMIGFYTNKLTEGKFNESESAMAGLGIFTGVLLDFLYSLYRLMT